MTVKGKAEARPEEEADVAAGNHAYEPGAGNDADVFLTVALEPFVDVFGFFGGLDGFPVLDQRQEIDGFGGQTWC